MRLLRFRYFLLLTFCISFNISAQIVDKNVKTWAKYERYAQANRELKGVPDVVFIGNSITDFWAKKMPDFFCDNNYVGRGISGQTTDQMLSRFQQDVVELHPKFVVILAGINDIAQNNGPISNENILNNIKSMCDVARVNGIKPVLCSILPCDYFVWRKDLEPAPIVVETNKLIRAYASSMKFPYVDYYSAMATNSGALKPEYTSDRCHPNEEGYKVMTSVIQKVLKSLIIK